MEKLKEYLRICKEHGWTLDMAALVTEYKLTVNQVRECINEIYIY